MLLPEGELKILDFGVARVADVTLTKSRDTLGTVSYMAPEQVRGDRLDGRADLWALGVVLYEMLTGRRPFEGPHEIAIAHAILHADPPVRRRSGPRSGPSWTRWCWGYWHESQAGDPHRPKRSRPSWLRWSHGRRRPGRVSGGPDSRNRRALVWASTFALVVAAGGAAAWLLRPGAAAGSAEPRIVAVLPFADLGGHDDTDYLAVALPDQIATRLSRLSAVAVAADSVRCRRSRERRGPAHGRRRAAPGRPVRRGSEATSVDPRVPWPGQHRAGAAAERDGGNRRGAGPRRDSRANAPCWRHVPTARRKRTTSILRGRAAQIGAAPDDSSQRRMESLQRAQSYYAQARESDPDFAAPRAGLAMLHLALARYDRTSARRDQARIEAEAALRLNPGCRKRTRRSPRTGRSGASR